MVEKGHRLLENFLEDRYSKDEYLELLKQFGDDGQFEKLKGELEKVWESTDGSFVSFRMKCIRICGIR
ncbi:hypothetical protein [Sunxiuqinia sp. sy24]|uniref:hypothetical protein n=1 Tax=Sunxiuqinia sp. sy24 TaxID=3461495 RepID=UPI0040458658